MAKPLQRYRSVLDLVEAKAVEKLGVTAGKLMPQVFAATLESMAAQPIDGPLAELLEDTKTFYYEREVWQKLFPGEAFVGNHPDAEALHDASTTLEPRSAVPQGIYDEVNGKYEHLKNEHQQLCQNNDAARRENAALSSGVSSQSASRSSRDDREPQAGGRPHGNRRDGTSTSISRSGNQPRRLSWHSAPKFDNLSARATQYSRPLIDYGRFELPLGPRYSSGTYHPLPSSIPLTATSQNLFKRAHELLSSHTGRSEPSLGWHKTTLDGKPMSLPHYCVQLKTTNAWQSFLGDKGNHVALVNEMLPRCLRLRGDKLYSGHPGDEDSILLDLAIVWIEPVPSASPRDRNVISMLETGYRILKAWANERLSPPGNPSEGPSIVDFWIREKDSDKFSGEQLPPTQFRPAQRLAHHGRTATGDNGGRNPNGGFISRFRAEINGRQRKSTCLVKRDMYSGMLARPLTLKQEEEDSKFDQVPCRSGSERGSAGPGSRGNEVSRKRKFPEMDRGDRSPASKK
ncbi:hypothetical protein BJ875DRAFT_440672 [Amylocarpus encephaloides]|uniref:Uncharacterized protein n=1 Tax=Amylocarpus encephaloides TaxID=45428 RepID=A0A9P8C6A8_9HELO|nr:hypothetical protein BJ875DRAFT_440672 [Amylocarpus encephaloides]